MNPYLQGQANAITQQATQNLQNNILPGINSNFMAAGGYGGSRQGIAQGLAIGQTNQGITNSLAGLYGQAYEADQNRAAQQAMNQAQMSNSLEVARLNNETQRLGLANQYNLGLGNLALGNRQADQSYGLGLGNLDVNRMQASTQRDLGFGNLALGNRQADQSYQLGMGNLGLGYQNSANQYNLGLMNNQTQRDLGFAGLDNQRYGMDQNFYTAQRGQDQQGQRDAMNMLSQAQQMEILNNNALYNAGLNQFNAPGNVLNQYAGMLSPFTGLNSTTTANSPGGGGGFGGFLGGALTGAQLWNLLNRP